MECVGFEIRSGYLLAYSGQEFDLHNDFDVTGIFHDPSTATLSVTLRRYDGAWVSRRLNTPSPAEKKPFQKTDGVGFFPHERLSPLLESRPASHRAVTAGSWRSGSR